MPTSPLLVALSLASAAVTTVVTVTYIAGDLAAAAAVRPPAAVPSVLDAPALSDAVGPAPGATSRALRSDVVSRSGPATSSPTFRRASNPTPKTAGVAGSPDRMRSTRAAIAHAPVATPRPASMTTSGNPTAASGAAGLTPSSTVAPSRAAGAVGGAAPVRLTPATVSRPAAPVSTAPWRPAVATERRVRIGSWSRPISVSRLSQSAIDRCRAAVLWHGALPGAGGTTWLAGHDYCGFARWAGLRVGTLVTIDWSGRTLTYQVVDRLRLDRQTGDLQRRDIREDLMLQTCAGRGTVITYARLV